MNNGKKLVDANDEQVFRDNNRARKQHARNDADRLKLAESQVLGRRLSDGKSESPHYSRTGAGQTAQA